MAKELTPAAHLESFLDFVSQCESRYALACGNVSLEDKRLQDLLHEIELAPSKADCNRAAGKLRENRRIRRENKDEAKLYEQVVRFFEDQANRRTLNQMKQLLGRQRREDEAKLYEQVVRFFEDQGNRRTLNQMKQLLGRQRREEEYLFGEREYKPRVNG